jgi:phage shock protein A
MSKPNVLTQILAAIQEVDSKVDALQTQLDQLEQTFPSDLSAQLTELDGKVTEIQSILTGVEPEPQPEPEPEAESVSRRRKQK